MFTATILLGYLAVSSPAPRAVSVSLPLVQDKQAAVQDPLDADFEKLMQEIQGAYEAYLEKKKTDPKTPRWEVSFYDKFAALAAKGHGPSLLWTAMNAQHKFEGKKEITAKKLEFYERVIKEHGSKDWAPEIVDAINGPKERKYFGMPEVDKLLSQVKTSSTNREAQASALEALIKLFESSSAGESERKRAVEYKATLLKDFQDTSIVIRMNAEEFKKTNLVVGKPVPDIAGKDIEGVDFKLSDYKGKVVLLDYWGFW